MSETPMDSTSNVNSPDEPMSTSQQDEPDPRIKTPLCTDSEDEESAGLSALIRSRSQQMRTPDSDFEPPSSASTSRRKGSKRQRSTSTKCDSRVPVRQKTVPWYPDNRAPPYLEIPQVMPTVQADVKCLLAKYIEEGRNCEFWETQPQSDGSTKSICTILDCRTLVHLANCDELVIIKERTNGPDILVPISSRAADTSVGRITNPTLTRGLHEFWSKRPHVPVNHALPVIELEAAFPYPFDREHQCLPTDDTWSVFIYAHSNIFYNGLCYAANCRHPVTKWD